MAMTFVGSGARAGSRRWTLLVVLALLLALGAVAAPGPAANASAASAASAGSGAVVQVAETAPLRPVPARYAGFSIDPANLCDVVRLAREDPAFVQLFRNLGPGVLRVGGNTGNRKARWSTTEPANCVYFDLVVTPSLVDDFFTFAASIGYRVMWQVPLDNGHPDEDVAEAQYVSTKPGLTSLEFGNEPEYYPDAHTKYQAYIDEWKAVHDAYRSAGGTAPVTGPGTMYGAGFYNQPFLEQHHADLSSLTLHYYAGSATTNPTCEDLIATDGVENATAGGEATASQYGLPYVINETNTYTHYGKQGVSNAFCSALWAADYLQIGLHNGVQGLYFHGTDNYTRGNSAGEVQCYTPINNDGTPAPEYYGILYSRQLTKAGGSEVATTKVDPETTLNTSAVAGDDGRLRVSLVNRSDSPRKVVVTTRLPHGSASAVTLAAPSLTSLDGVTLGGAAVAADGTWTPKPAPVLVAGRAAVVTVPAYAGVLVTYGSAGA